MRMGKKNPRGCGWLNTDPNTWMRLCTRIRNHFSPACFCHISPTHSILFFPLSLLAILNNSLFFNSSLFCSWLKQEGKCYVTAEHPAIGVEDYPSKADKRLWKSSSMLHGHLKAVICRKEKSPSLPLLPQFMASPMLNVLISDLQKKYALWQWHYILYDKWPSQLPAFSY